MIQRGTRVLSRPGNTHAAQSLPPDGAFWQLIHRSQRAGKIGPSPARDDRIHRVALILALGKGSGPSHCSLRIALSPRTGNRIIGLRTRLSGIKARRPGRCGGRVPPRPCREDRIQMLRWLRPTEFLGQFQSGRWILAGDRIDDTSQHLIAQATLRQLLDPVRRRRGILTGPHTGHRSDQVIAVL